MRAKPYYKKSHKAWYVNLASRPKRLGTNEQEAYLAYGRLVSQAQGEWSVAELVAKFLDYHGKTSEKSTCRYYRQIEAFAANLGDTPASDLKPFHVLDWIESNPVSPRIIRALKACFRWADKQGYIEQNPLRNLETPKSTCRGDDAYLSPEQLESFLRIVPSDFYNLVAVMHETGCRPQEIRRVESRHFKDDCWIFPVNESKGKRNSRIVHLSDHAFEICQRLALKYPEGKLFRNSHGRPWSTGNLVSRFERLSKRLGFRVTAYTMRHTFATEAIIKGVDLQTLSVLMGHASLKMLSQVYAHVNRRADHLKRALDKMAS
jgi:integrase